MATKRTSKAAVPEANKKPPGRPPWDPTEQDREQIAVFAMLGLPHSRIARLYDVSENTLRKTCRRELTDGKEIIDGKIVGNLARQALRDDHRCIAAAIYWTKAQMGWIESSRLQLAGHDGGPLQPSVIVLPDNERGDRQVTDGDADRDSLH